MERGLETREIINIKERQEEDEEEEEKICRICHIPGDSENPLQYPCACSGSIKFVHPKCLLQWMKQRITPACEVCKHKFSVYRVYAENTPTRLPLGEFVCGSMPCSALLFMSPSTLMMDWLYGIGSLLVVTTVLVLRGFNLNLEIRFDVPLRVQFAKDIKRFLITFWKLIFVPFSFERIILHCLSWFCYGASSIFMTFTKSALQMENNSLKNAVTNLSAGIQNDGLLSCAVGVVAESLTANSIGQGEASSSVGQPLLVYRSSCVYDVITLATGYMVVLPLVCAGFDIPIRTVASKIHYYLRKFLTRMVYPFFLIIHLGVLPLIYGWFLDICTIRMFGKSISDRVEFFSKFPLLSSSLHWAIGITYMFQIRISTSLLQRVLRKEVLHFLQDLADPIYNILYVVANDVQVKASQLLFFVAVVGTFIVFLVYLLVTLAMRLAPTIFPLHNSLSDPLTEIPVVMLLLQVCLPYAIELRETIGAVLYQWVTSVCCVLGLSDFLCSRPEDIGWQQNVKEERKQDRLIAAQDPNKNNNDGYTFVLRVVLLVILVWIPLLLLSSSLIIVFLPLRRVLFSSISYHSITHGVKCNNLYVFFVRNFSIWTSLTGARFFVEHFKPGKTHVQFSDICKLLRFIVEKCVLLSLWIIVIPVLIGLLFELSVMVSIQALVVEAPVLLLCQDLAVGFFFFKLWRTLVLLNHRIVLVDESWRVKFERIRDNDFLKLPGLWMLQEIMIPFIRNLLLSLCFPYIFARWIVPSLGLSQTVNSTVYRFTWVA